MEAKSPALPKNVISIVGPSGSGKTELICRLVTWFREKGLTVAVLKHGHERKKIAESQAAQDYRRAGARAVALAGPHLVQITHYPEGEPDLAETLAVLAPQSDVVIVEGYKQSPLPKLVFLKAGAEPIAIQQAQIVALVSREPTASPLPVFRPDEVEGIGRFILKYLGEGK